MSRTPIIAGNWKMQKTKDEALELIKGLIESNSQVKDREIIVCPPSLYTDAAVQNAKGSNIQVGVQNCYFEPKGAFTGELAVNMIKSVGASHVIIGHSERRQYFGETDESVNKKTKAVLAEGLTPIVCIGETLEQRESNETFRVIEKQIKEGLRELEIGYWKLVIVAYEPVWAIGTGKTATPAQAQEVHAYIRKLLAEGWNTEVANSVRILYGGSMKPDNVSELMQQPDIDGGLVGGAALKVDSFTKIIQYK